MLGQLLDLLFGYAQVIEPLFSDLLTGTLFHRFLDIIAGNIGEEAVYPYADLLRILLFELSLTIDGPA